MKQVDYHHFLVEDALRHADTVISEIRMTRRTETVEFITGFGKIRGALLLHLEGYGLEPTYKLGNAGTIICEVE